MVGTIVCLTLRKLFHGDNSVYFMLSHFNWLWTVDIIAVVVFLVFICPIFVSSQQQ